jgi:hypothetical protein
MNRERLSPIAVIAALVLLMFAVVLLLLLPHSALAADWDVGIKHLITTRMVYEGGFGKAGETTDTFTVGEEVLILCQYEYVKVGDKSKFKPWNVELLVNNILVKTVSVPSYDEPHKAPWAIYKTKIAGQPKIECSLGMLSDINHANDSAVIYITMKPGPPLTAAEIPTPLPASASTDQKIVLTPNLNFLMSAGNPATPVRGYQDFIDYHFSTPYVHKWHLELVRMIGAYERSAATPPVGTFQGEFDFMGIFQWVDRKWLDAHGAGAGHYAARFYYSETAKGVTTKGRAAVVKLELVEPLKAGQDTSPKTAQPSSPIIATKPKPEPPPPILAKPLPSIAAAVAKPNLSITGVSVKIEPNCQAPQPAMTAIVTIKNTGGALPANKGTVFVKEQGGTNLGSAGIQIPAIGAGQTQVVNIPAITSQPYSSLAGSHKVQVILNPQSEEGQISFNKSADPYMFSATFLSGHCKPTQRQQPGQQQRR